MQQVLLAQSSQEQQLVQAVNPHLSSWQEREKIHTLTFGCPAQQQVESASGSQLLAAILPPWQQLGT